VVARLTGYSRNDFSNLVVAHFNGVFLSVDKEEEQSTCNLYNIVVYTSASVNVLELGQ
jgi:hypothetical protein